MRLVRTPSMRRCVPPIFSAKAALIPTNLAGTRQPAVSSAELGKHILPEKTAHEIWELWLAASKTSYVIDQCIATTEPAYLAKHAFQLAQLFNTFYHRYPILSETDEGRKRFLLATVAGGSAGIDPGAGCDGNQRACGDVAAAFAIQS